jgi:hypothetical protein
MRVHPSILEFGCRPVDWSAKTDTHAYLVPASLLAAVAVPAQLVLPLPTVVRTSSVWARNATVTQTSWIATAPAATVARRTF